MEQNNEFVQLLNKLKLVAGNLDQETFKLLIRRDYDGHTKHCRSIDYPSRLYIKIECTCDMIRDLILQMKRLLRLYKFLHIKCNCWWCLCDNKFVINSNWDLEHFLQREIPSTKVSNMNCD